jgi:cytochrome c553
MFLRLDGSDTESIGARIIETPVERERTEALRDPRSGFLAYVPTGSLKKGQLLATTGGNGRTIECATCHGDGLRGLGPVPGLAGRSPSYTMRQLVDMKHGTRKGIWTDLMTAVVARLNDDDMLALAAYTASLTP